MNGETFDNEGFIYAQGFIREMVVNMMFTDPKEDTKGDGDLITVFFNKPKDFHDRI